MLGLSLLALGAVQDPRPDAFPIGSDRLPPIAYPRQGTGQQEVGEEVSPELPTPGTAPAGFTGKLAAPKGAEAATHTIANPNYFTDGPKRLSLKLPKPIRIEAGSHLVSDAGLDAVVWLGSNSTERGTDGDLDRYRYGYRRLLASEPVLPAGAKLVIAGKWRGWGTYFAADGKATMRYLFFTPQSHVGLRVGWPLDSPAAEAEARRLVPLVLWSVAGKSAE